MLGLALARRCAAPRTGCAPAGPPRARRFGRRRPHRNEFRPEGHVEPEAPSRRPPIIINPTKFDDLPSVKRRITKVCSELGWHEPLFIETTAKDTGTGQARAALEEGVTSSARSAATAPSARWRRRWSARETPMGLLPGGTGNLLARNLEPARRRLEDALRVALTGQNKRVDVGRLTVDQSGEHERPEKHIFLVMAGLGFDAAIMADAPESLKAKVGWPAYVVSGARNLRGPQFKVRVKVDDSEEFSRRTRTVVIGNCGKLLGGLILMPEAEVADGKLTSWRCPRRASSAGPPSPLAWRPGGAGPHAGRPPHGHRVHGALGPPAGGPARRRPDRQGPRHQRRGRPVLPRRPSRGPD